MQNRNCTQILLFISTIFEKNFNQKVSTETDKFYDNFLDTSDQTLNAQGSARYN